MVALTAGITRNARNRALSPTSNPALNTFVGGFARRGDAILLRQVSRYPHTADLIQKPERPASEATTSTFQTCREKLRKRSHPRPQQTRGTNGSGIFQTLGILGPPTCNRPSTESSADDVLSRKRAIPARVVRVEERLDGLSHNLAANRLAYMLKTVPPQAVQFVHGYRSTRRSRPSSASRIWTTVSTRTASKSSRFASSCVPLFR